MTKRFILSFFLISSPFLLAGEKPDLIAEKVAVVDYYDHTSIHLFHANALWVGRVDTPTKPYRSVEAFSASGASLGEAKLKHSLDNISPFGPNQVIVFGKANSTGLFSRGYIIRRFTVLEISNGVPVVRREYEFKPKVYVSGLIGTPEKMILTLDDSGLMHFPSKKIFNSYVPIPRKGILIKDEAFAITSLIGKPGFGLARVNTKTEQVSWVFNDFRNKLMDLKNVADRFFVLAEYGASQVVIVDLLNPGQVKENAFPGAHSIALLGNCAVVGSYDEKALAVFSFASGSPERVLDWDLTDVRELKNTRFVTADSKTGKLFILSTDPGNGANNNYVFSLTDKTEKLKKTCGY